MQASAAQPGTDCQRAGPAAGCSQKQDVSKQAGQQATLPCLVLGPYTECACRAGHGKVKARAAAKQAKQDVTLALLPHMSSLLRLSQADACRVRLCMGARAAVCRLAVAAGSRPPASGTHTRAPAALLQLTCGWPELQRASQQVSLQSRAQHPARVACRQVRWPSHSQGQEVNKNVPASTAHQGRDAWHAQVASVAELVRHLNLDIYALRSAEASLEALLGELAQQATKQPAGATTRECLLAIHHCSTAAPDAVQVCPWVAVLASQAQAPRGAKAPSCQSK